MKILKRVIVAILILSFGFTIGYIAAVGLNYNSAYSTISENSAEESPVEYKVNTLKALINQYFIGDYDETQMADDVADAMVEATGDRWSYYISESDYQTYLEQMNNEYVGIGVTIQITDDESIEVVSVVEDGPAFEAGIKPQDIISAVEETSVQGMSLDEVKALVKGEEGTNVNITLLRGDQSFTVSVERRAIATAVAKLEMLDDDIAYITIENFDSKCADETISCIETAMDGGAKGIIFDVRFNPGGYKNELVEILDYILPEGELFRSVDYAGNENVDTSDADHIEIPMVVLVNADSYSAAEFFAAALMEYGVAEIVGEQTVGKGYFQYTYNLGDGSAVALSSGKYYTPSGKSLAGVGITPDYEVDLTDEEYAELYYGMLEKENDPQLQKAIDVLTSEILSAAKN